MKILFVTGMTIPLKDILSGKTEAEITGAPASFYPWYKLVQKGHQVDFILLSNFNEKINIKVDWFSEKNIYANIYDPYSEVAWYRRLPRRVKRLAKLFFYTNKALAEHEYDFVYCKAFYEGLPANIVANLRGIPSGTRSMGTMLYPELEKNGAILTAFKRPFEFLTFKIKKDFFLMTDDGTKGNLVYEYWKPRKKKYDYLFWKTGVDIKRIDPHEITIEIPDHPYIFFAARFEDWKNQDRILILLHELHKKQRYVHLYFAGIPQNYQYYEKIKIMVTDLKLEAYVHFLGGIKQADLRVYAMHAVANPLMYDYSNLGNVFFEMFTSGSVILGLNDGSLNDYIEHGENGFLINDEVDACGVIEHLLDNVNLIEKIRVNAEKSAKIKVLSIDERFDKEVNLIEDVVRKHKKIK